MVRIIEWDQKFSVGIKEIDDQHKVLTEILDDLYNAMLKAKGREVAQATLDRLFTYTKTHFTTEERLFKKYCYPEEEKHKAEHEAMLKRLNKFQRESKDGKAISVDLMLFLKGWFIDHLQTTDHRYVEFFKQKGVSDLH
ncbi:bacteriohemerythrin [Thiovibrio sp. JS02]